MLRNVQQHLSYCETKSYQNIHHSAPNRTIFKTFLVGACHRTLLINKAHEIKIRPPCQILATLLDSKHKNFVPWFTDLMSVCSESNQSKHISVYLIRLYQSQCTKQ